MTNEIEIPETNWRGRISRYAPLFLWVGVIFFLSTGQASMSETSRFVRPVLNFLFPGAPEETLVVYHAYVRKFAHFAVYFVLAFFAARAFADSHVAILKRYQFPFSLALVFAVAAIDETNQSFNDARTGSIYDVLLDVFGGATMLALYFIYRLRKNT